MGCWARAGFAPADYKREDYQIERLHRIAVDAGLDPDVAEISLHREFVVTEAKRAVISASRCGRRSGRTRRVR